jgi:transcriptional regulator with XRE-family HTH domain
MPHATDEDLDWGTALAMLRIVRSWTQGQLGHAVGLGYRTVSNYEKGLRTAPPALLRQMVAAMGFPAHLLDRARALVRWARAARQLNRRPAADAAGACVEVMAGAAGLAREELARAALAGLLRVSPGEEAAPDEGEPPGAPAPASPERGPLAMARTDGGAATPGESSPPVPKTLRVLRLIAGLERDELAAAIGATRLMIQNYERGTTTPLAGTLQRLLDAMDLPAESSTAPPASWTWRARPGRGTGARARHRRGRRSNIWPPRRPAGPRTGCAPGSAGCAPPPGCSRDGGGRRRSGPGSSASRTQRGGRWCARRRSSRTRGSASCSARRA